LAYLLLSGGNSKDLIRTNDYIYSKQDFDSSPVVLESHNLIFFTVAGAGDETWRCLFRRMMGYSDWKNTSRQFEGLRYLYDYDEREAAAIMTSPDYTRAMFVRDPKLRVLSSYLDHVVKDKGAYILDACCGFLQSECVDPVLQSFSNFLDMIKKCDEPFWRPQGQKMEPKYYSLLNFVGHYETAEDDARRLLDRIGAWDEYGSSGWGTNADEAIFYKVQEMEKKIFRKYYKPSVQHQVEDFYKLDYSNPTLNLTRKYLRN
jgi:hypothetical protein